MNAKLPNKRFAFKTGNHHTFSFLDIEIIEVIRNIQKQPLRGDLNPIQDGQFRGCSRMGGDKKAPLPKICHTYPTIMKLGTVIPYLKKIQKICESRNTPR